MQITISERMITIATCFAAIYLLLLIVNYKKEISKLENQLNLKHQETCNCIDSRECKEIEE